MSLRTRSGRGIRAALLAATLATVLAGAEILLRWLDLPHFDACSSTADYADPDPQLGFAPAPGGNIRGVALNEMGLRGPLLPQSKPQDHFRLLFIGDSTCWGVFVPTEKIFAVRATELLSADRPDERFEFLIGAFPGYSSYHSRILLERMLPMQPDLVVFYVGARNDPSRARYFPDGDIPSRRARLLTAWHRVRLLRLIEVATDRSYRSLFRKLRSASSRARVPPEVFRENLDRMAKQIADAGVPGLIVLPPISAAFAEKLPLALEYRRILEDVGRRHQLPTVELQAAFDAEAPERTYFSDMYHFTAHGHEVAAREIHRAIREQGLLQRSRDPRSASTD